MIGNEIIRWSIENGKLKIDMKFKLVEIIGIINLG